jgi:guanine nucleotide-binding protein subunit alpha, other
MSSLDRLFDPSYQPTEQDILLSQSRTSGITETIFQAKDQGMEHDIMVVDVSEYTGLRKWINQFQDVASIFFVVNLCGYDQSLPDDRGVVCLFLAFKVRGLIGLVIQNQMQYALSIWDSVCQSHWLRHTSIVSITINLLSIAC